MKTKLPKWVVDNRTAVLEECAPYRGLTQRERAAHLHAAMRLGHAIRAGQRDPERALAWKDPLPRSSELVLARLRAPWRKRWLAQQT